MVRGTMTFLLLAFLASGAVFGAEDRVDVANIDKDLQMQILRSAVNPAVTEKYEYYEIRGNDARELRRQMKKNGTKWDDGKTYDSVTSWNVRWDYDYHCGGPGCTVDSFKTKVNITFRYPKWVRAEDASSELIEKWDRYMKNLVLHEKGHADMAVQAAAELGRAVSELPPAPSRADLDRAVKTLARDWNAKLSSDQRAYDAATTHGRSQGAVFP